MALARAVAHVIANRALNGVWLGYLRALALRAIRDRAYAEVMGGVMAGVLPTRDLLAGSIAARSLQAFADFLARRRTVAAVIGAAIDAGLAMAEHGEATRRWARGSVGSWSDLLLVARDVRRASEA